MRWIPLDIEVSRWLSFNYYVVRAMPKLTPNSHKPKLPKFLSYPVGFEKLSIHMGDALRTDVKLVFASPSGVVVRDIRNERRHRVITASYTNWERSLSKSASLDQLDFYGPKAELWVFPVAREHRFEVVELLDSEGFESVRQWLAVPRNSTWQLSRHDLTIFFVPNEVRLDYEGDKAISQG
jgi:hypothetical protein